MSHNDLRTVVVGATAGAVAGAVTVLGIITADDMDLWGKAQQVLARHRRLSTAPTSAEGTTTEKEN